MKRSGAISTSLITGYLKSNNPYSTRRFSEKHRFLLHDVDFFGKVMWSKIVGDVHSWSPDPGSA